MLLTTRNQLQYHQRQMYQKPKTRKTPIRLRPRSSQQPQSPPTAQKHRPTKLPQHILQPTILIQHTQTHTQPSHHTTQILTHTQPQQNHSHRHTLQHRHHNLTTPNISQHQQNNNPPHQTQVSQQPNNKHQLPHLPRFRLKPSQQLPEHQLQRNQSNAQTEYQ